MKSGPKTIVLLTLCVLAGLMSGCIRPTSYIPTPTPTISTPSWHQLQSGLYTTAEGRFFYGIGRAGGINNSTLLRATADNDAHKELADVFTRYMGELTKSSALKADPYWMALSPDERQLVLGTLIRQSLRQAAVSDHWRDEQQPVVRSLCRLDLEAFKKIVADSPSLEDTTQAVMLTEMDTLYNRLSK